MDRKEHVDVQGVSVSPRDLLAASFIIFSVGRLAQDLTFYGVLGIKDPLRADVKAAVADCRRASINVRM